MTNDTPKDEELSRLYREGTAAEPAPALDAAIRAAAREALAVRPARPQPWWQRWRLPVGVFATLVLTVSLSLLVERERDREAATADAPAAARATDGAAEKSAPLPQVQERASPAAAAENSALAVRRVAPPAPAESAAPAVPAVPAAPAVPSIPSAPAAARVAAPQLAAPAVSSVPATAPASEALTADAVKPRPAAAEAGVSGQAADRAPAAAMMKRELKSAAPAVLAPEAWIEEIRRLQREGRNAEAQRQLAEFARAYPDFRLPEDVKR